jgi:hypothetical protein
MSTGGWIGWGGLAIGYGLIDRGRRWAGHAGDPWRAITPAVEEVELRAAEKIRIRQSG